MTRKYRRDRRRHAGSLLASFSRLPATHAGQSLGATRTCRRQVRDVRYTRTHMKLTRFTAASASVAVLSFAQLHHRGCQYSTLNGCIQPVGRITAVLIRKCSTAKRWICCMPHPGDVAGVGEGERRIKTQI